MHWFVVSCLLPATTTATHVLVPNTVDATVSLCPEPTPIQRCIRALWTPTRRTRLTLATCQCTTKFVEVSSCTSGLVKFYVCDCRDMTNKRKKTEYINISCQSYVLIPILSFCHLSRKTIVVVVYRSELSRIKFVSSFACEIELTWCQYNDFETLPGSQTRTTLRDDKLLTNASC